MNYPINLRCLKEPGTFYRFKRFIKLGIPGAEYTYVRVFTGESMPSVQTQTTSIPYYILGEYDLYPESYQVISESEFINEMDKALDLISKNL